MKIKSLTLILKEWKNQSGLRPSLHCFAMRQGAQVTGLAILFFTFFASWQLFFFFNSVLAVGIGVEPSFLDLQLRVAESQKTKILVYNIYQQPGLFQIFPDGLEGWISIEPNNFRLEAGEKKEVEITILAKRSGKKKIDLSVLVNPLGWQSFGVSSGIKIPLRLNIVDGKSIFLASVFNYVSRDWICFSGIFIAFVILFFLLKYLESKKFNKNEQNSLRVSPPI